MFCYLQSLSRSSVVYISLGSGICTVYDTKSLLRIAVYIHVSEICNTFLLFTRGYNSNNRYYYWCILHQHTKIAWDPLFSACKCSDVESGLFNIRLPWLLYLSRILGTLMYNMCCWSLMNYKWELWSSSESSSRICGYLESDLLPFRT